ncbi:hypothetical protein KOW79_008839 [Hemibagrus wyckioides]|uniref:Uncharacterized protein n=1 Tax=Hemibagrus wyckioides TaxID=337641 RepID=A0A9D3NQK7_9TELE|nr:hypothetical protein KOW79_008839 [Hemibagrus wyckioides]
MRKMKSMCEILYYLAKKLHIISNIGIEYTSLLSFDTKSKKAVCPSCSVVDSKERDCESISDSSSTALNCLRRRKLN